MTNDNISEQNTTKDTQSEVKKTPLEKHIEKALEAVQRLPISDDLSDSRKAKIERLNERIIAATRKRAIAEFRERELIRKVESAKARAAASAESAAVRRRREHLIYTIGAYEFEKARKCATVSFSFISKLLSTLPTAHAFNRTKAEFLEFFPVLKEHSEFQAFRFARKEKKEADQ